MRNRHVRHRRVFRKVEEPALFAPTVEDRVPEDHLVRRLKGIVELVAGPELRMLYDDKGGVGYDPVSLLSVELYGSMLGIRSSRELEELCRYDARFWFLTGSLTPDHNTLARFRVRLEASLPEICARVLQRARDLGLLGMKVVAVDGTKIEGNVSQWKKLVRRGIEADEESSDPDAGVMRTGKGTFLVGYNAQIAVDKESGLIVGETVSQQPADAHQMPEVMDSIEHCVGVLPETALADKGYDSGPTHVDLARRGVEGIIPPQGGRDFWKLDPGGKIACPEGHEPLFRARKSWRGRSHDIYQVPVCNTCPLKPSCAPGRSKTLTAPAGTSPATRLLNDLRAHSPRGQDLIRQRKTIVEPVFGHLKGNLGFRRFRTRGLANVRTEFKLQCLAFNLKKLLRRQLWLWRSEMATLPRELVAQTSRPRFIRLRA